MKTSRETMIKRIKNWDIVRITGILSFLIPVMVMLILFGVNGIYPFGDRCFLSTDLYHQYTPFFTEFMRSIKEGDGLSYSWNIGVGSNFLALYVYYLASPFHFLGLLVPENFIIEFLSYLVVVKIGFCGGSAFWYFYHRKTTIEQGRQYKAVVALFFALAYALSGFMAAYNWNIMWLDCVVLLPLILYGLEKLVFEHKPYFYCIVLALSIFTNYYISIMICIFLVLYFGYLFFQKASGRAVWQFALFSLLAGGLAGVLLIPEVCAILATDFGAVEFPKKVQSYFSVLDMLARHCMTVSVEKGLDHWPNIYCGVAAFFFVPLYGLNEKIPAKKRFGLFALAGILLLSFSTSILNFIWHGLNYPDSLPARQSFLYCFVILMMCFDGAMHLDFADMEQKKRMISVYFGVASLILFFEKFADHEDVVAGAEWLSLLFVTIYAVCWYLLYQYRTGFQKKILLLVLVVAVSAELLINTEATSISNVSRTAYLEHLEDYRELYRQTKEEDSEFYRLEKFTRKTKNDGALVGYPTASLFSSTMNSSVMDFYKRMGMRHSKVYYEYDGSTAFSSALLNVKYLFGTSPEYENSQFSLFKELNDIYLFRATQTLPLGYVAPKGYDLPDGYSDSGLRLQNQMIHELGIDGQLFEKCDCETAGKDVIFTAPENGIYYGILESTGIKKVKLTGTTPDEMEWKDLKKGSILYLGYLKAGNAVRIKNNEKEDDTDTAKITASVYRMDEALLEQAIRILGANHMEQVQFVSTHLSGRIDLQEPGRVILSIPYEKGTRVKVNGEKVEPATFGGTFVALDLEPGAYEIELQYVPYGQLTGRIVSVVSLVGLVALFWFGKRKRERKKQI